MKIWSCRPWDGSVDEFHSEAPRASIASTRSDDAHALKFSGVAQNLARCPDSMEYQAASRLDYILYEMRVNSIAIKY